MVFIFHYGASFAGRTGFPKPAVTFLQNGYLGVSLFFILSGFIITYSYIDRLDGRNGLSNFAIARFSRVYPVYLLALMVALPLAWAELDIRKMVLVLLMVQSWTLPGSHLGASWVMQAWTLSIELFFYLFCPAIILLCRNLSTRVEFIAAAFAAFVLVTLHIPTISPGYTDFVLPAVAYVPLPMLRSVEFLYGMMLCRLYLRMGSGLKWLGSTPLVLLNIAVIGILLASTMAGFFVSLAMVLVGIVLVQLAIGGNIVATILSSRPLLLLGGSSYALYLLQGPVRAWLQHLPNVSIAQVINPVVALAASILVFVYWEEPCRRFIRRWFESPKTLTPAPSLTE